MSIGKFEPSYHNPYSRPHLGNGASKADEASNPSGQVYFNGFSAPELKPQAENFDNFDKGKLDTEEDDLEKFIHIEVHPNGGASIVRIYDSEIAGLDAESKEKLAKLFFEEVFREESDHVAKHVMGIVQGAVSYMPELVSYLAMIRPELDIKVGAKKEYKYEEGGPGVFLSLCLVEVMIMSPP
jgi:hypothetical protein